jgi:hypothetical protein
MPSVIAGVHLAEREHRERGIDEAERFQDKKLRVRMPGSRSVSRTMPTISTVDRGTVIPAATQARILSR